MRVIPNDLHIPGGRSSNESLTISRRVRDYYLGSREVSEDTMDEMIDVIPEYNIFIKLTTIFLHNNNESFY